MKRAFTLIELLVVIAIIGILTMVVTVNLSSARSKARDAKRKSDLNTISQALEMYNDANGGYPAAEYPDQSITVGNSIAQYSRIEADGKQPSMRSFLPTMPSDPRNSDSDNYNINYVYQTDNERWSPSDPLLGTKYALYATLEDQATNNLSNSNYDVPLRNGDWGHLDLNYSGRANYKIGNL